jgi:hypothetical protein
MLENAGDSFGIGYFANHAEIPAAFRTHTQIDTEHRVEPGHPGHGRRGHYAGVLALLGADGRDEPGHDEVTVSGVAPYGHTTALAHLSARDQPCCVRCHAASRARPSSRDTEGE